ncbi:MAG: RNA polymerase subunit sigma [Planctomycetota bacterium]|nr:RNA polymerase subunit sigma [Planctomycetota bacterium]
MQEIDTPHADPATFFAAPPTTPSALFEARGTFLADALTTNKFDAAVANAREAGNRTLAACGSWVSGQYEKALEFADTEDAMGRFIAGSSLLELNRAEEAVEALASDVKSEDTLHAATLLYAMEAAGAFDQLQKALRTATLSPSDEAFFHARLLETKGDVQAAAEGYEALLEANETHFAARFRLAFLCDLHGDDDTAKAHYESLLVLKPIPVSVLMNLGLFYEDLEQFDKACGCFGAILRRDPNNPRARLYFQDAHESLDMYYDEDLERKEDKLHQMLRTPISDFELSVRARNCLATMDIRTLGDLVSHSEPELLEFKNFGETSLTEIKQVLTAKGLRLGLRREDGSYSIPDEFDSDSAGSDFQLEWMGEITEDQREALELPISSLNLSVRCHRALVERLSLQRIGDILRFSIEDLMAMPNFGITSLNELEAKLEELNLVLRKGKETQLL